MKFSIITPTHSTSNLPFLVELYESICSQTYTNWEWVVYLNGPMAQVTLPRGLSQDKRVKIYIDDSSENKIGAIKNKAFFKGIGDVLVEVDHDDLLMPTCLEELEKAFQDSEVGFVYSDSITFHMEETNQPYRADYGWTYKMVNWRDKERISMNHFPPTSQSLSYIWYAPDHVRAWRNSVYRDIGGHNINYSVCDDHELCIRTYLHTKMKFIPKPLYVYRITGDNTWLERNQLIQETTKTLFNNYSRLLAEKDAEDRNLLKIDLGGGLFPYKDYKTVDIREHADYVADLNKGIPLEDNSVGVINASHIIEHLRDPIHTMKEIHRVLAHGGWVFIDVPSTDGRGAWQDPTHVSFWNQNSFFYYTRQEQAQFIDNDTIRFQEYKLNTYFPNKFFKDNNIPVVSAVLVAIKDDSIRFPGPLTI